MEVVLGAHWQYDALTCKGAARDSGGSPHDACRLAARHSAAIILQSSEYSRGRIVCFSHAR